jgi:hypothetical protein
METVRREKLLQALAQQVEAAESEIQGVTLMATRMKRIKNAETGLTELVPVKRPVPRWFFSDVRGNWYLQVRYGTRRLPLVDGRDTVEVGSKASLVAVLETITQAVRAGELDKAMREVRGPKGRKTLTLAKTENTQKTVP